MPANSTKRVVLYRFDRQPAEGFVTDTRFGSDGLEVMSLDGMIQKLTYSELKAVCFVSGAGPFDLFREHSSFERRPKIPGLWVRFALRDGDVLEGVVSSNLSEWPESGFLATPPKAGGTRQRVFLPRLALLGTELCGIVKGISRAKVQLPELPGSGEEDGEQLSMF